jgi:hypothetical protein
LLAGVGVSGEIPTTGVQVALGVVADLVTGCERLLPDLVGETLLTRDQIEGQRNTHAIRAA